MSENNLHNLSNDSSVSGQYFDTMRRSEHLEPEKALLIALLEDAIDNYRKLTATRDRQGKEQFREAEAWIMARDDKWIFGFDSVCELLGLDPDYIRRGLREHGAKRPDEGEGRRQRFRRRRAA